MRSNSRLSPLLLLAGIAFATLGCSPQQKIERRLADGDKAYLAGDYEKAEIEYLEALVLKAGNPDALGRLGMIAYNRGLVIPAYSFLEQALKERPDNDDFRLTFALANFSAARTNDARMLARKVLEKRPRDEVALMLLADTCVTTRDNQEARRMIEDLQTQHGPSAGFHIALGALARRQKQFGGAEAELRKALELDPQSSAAYDQLNLLYAAMGDQTQATASLQKAASLAGPRAVVRTRYAHHLVRTGAREDAKKELAAIIAQAPDSVPALLLQARLALDDRQFEEAVALAKKVLERDSANHDGLLQLASARFAQGDSEGGIAELKRAESAYARLPQIKYQLALAYVNRGEPHIAEEYLKNALSLSPSFDEAAVLLAQLNLQKGNPAETITRLKAVLERRPKSRRAQVLLAQAYQASGDHLRGMAILRSLVEAAPNVPDNHYLMGLALLGRDPSAARRAFEETVALAETHWPAQEILVMDDLAAGRGEAAARRAEGLVAKFPEQAHGWLLRATVRLAGADLGGAESDLQKALAIEPNIPRAYVLLARIYFETKRGQEAIDALAASAASTKRAGLYTQLGMLHVALGQYEPARDAYEKALALEANFIPALNNLAALYADQLKQLEKAHTLARQAHDRAPGDPMVADTLGWILFQRGQYAGALPLLELSADKLPTDIAVLHHLAMTYYFLGQETAARQTFARVVGSAGESPLKADAQARLMVLDINPDEPGSTARATLAQHVERNPGDVAALTRLGLIEARGGDPRKAAEFLEAALKINPRSVRVLVSLVDLYFGPMANLERARELANKAHDLVPNDGNVSWRLGTLALRTRDYAWAASLLQDAVRSLPNQPELRFELAQALYGAGKVVEAEAAIADILRSEAPPSTLAAAQQMSAMLLALKQPANLTAAAVAAGSVLSSQPEDLPAQMVIAAHLEQQGKYEDAAQVYRKILAQADSFSPAVRELAVLYAEQLGDDAKAEQLAVKARQNMPEDPDLAFVLGSVSYRRADYAGAARYLRQGLRTRADHAPTEFLLGVSLYYQKNAPESRAHLERALQLKLPPQEATEAERLLEEIAQNRLGR